MGPAGRKTRLTRAPGWAAVDVSEQVNMEPPPQCQLSQSGCSTLTLSPREGGEGRGGIDLEWGGVLLLACPASTILVPGEATAALGGESVHPAPALRLMASGWGRQRAQVLGSTRQPLLWLLEEPRAQEGSYLFQVQHALPLLAWAAYALATHISSFLFRSGVWGERLIPRGRGGGGGADASLALTWAQLSSVPSLLPGLRLTVGETVIPWPSALPRLPP